MPVGVGSSGLNGFLKFRGAQLPDFIWTKGLGFRGYRGYRGYRV